MIRISPGRPLTSTRLFVEVCARIDVHAHLPEGLNPGGGPAPAPPLSVEWSDHPGRPWTTVNATVAWTPQRLGGTRAWWVCPGCRRRCRFLLSPGPPRPFRCRRCHGCVYLSDYPSRLQIHHLKQVLGFIPGGVEDQLAEADRLLSPKKRGQRRGRRVQQRGFKALERIERWRL